MKNNLSRALNTAKLRQSAVNQDVLQTLLYRASSIGGGASTILLVPLFLAPNAQGIYYLFLSLATLQVFFELGVSSVLTQFVSHEAAHIANLRDNPLGHIQTHSEKLLELYRKFHRFYAISSIAFLVCFFLIGPPVLLYNSSLSLNQWLPQLLCFGFLASINLYLIFYQAILEGLGCIDIVSRYRKRQTLFGYMLFLVLLLAHGKLWVTIALPLSTALFSSYLAFRVSGIYSIVRNQPNKGTQSVYSWAKDILPLQWKISTSWISGFFLFNLIVPLSFAHLGSVEAGKIGIAITIANSLQTFSLSMVYAFSPSLSMSIARGHFQRALSLFRHSSLKSLVLFLLLSTVFLSILSWLAFANPSYASRFPSPTIVAMLFTNTLLNLGVSLMAIYMRAYRREPMVWISILTAAIASAVLWRASFYGIYEIAKASLAVTGLFALPATILLFVPYYKTSSLNLDVT